MIVTPYGIAAVTILMALARTTRIKLTVAGAVLFILFLDWLAMLAAHVIVRWLGPVLLLLGVVLAVNQVALGLQLMIGGISGLIEQGASTAPSN
jgi:multiple antibiotic resistance protein